MSTKNNGGTAFPFPAYTYPNGEINHGEGGMSLRDYFAAKALPAVMDGSWPDLQFGPQSGESIVQGCARFAYEVADAMLAERAKAEGGAL